MNPGLHELSQRFDYLTDRGEVMQALDAIEDHYDLFDAVEPGHRRSPDRDTARQAGRVA
jgi:hypothetical protein